MRSVLISSCCFYSWYKPVYDVGRNPYAREDCIIIGWYWGYCEAVDCCYWSILCKAGGLLS